MARFLCSNQPASVIEPFSAYLPRFAPWIYRATFEWWNRRQNMVWTRWMGGRRREREEFDGGMVRLLNAGDGTIQSPLPRAICTRPSRTTSPSLLRTVRKVAHRMLAVCPTDDTEDEGNSVDSTTRKWEKPRSGLVDRTCLCNRERTESMHARPSNFLLGPPSAFSSSSSTCARHGGPW